MKSKILLPELVILFFSNAASSQWNLEEGIISTDLQEVNFWNNGHGAILGAGLTMFSEDGGDTWTSIVVPDLTNCFSFSFPQEDTGYVLFLQTHKNDCASSRAGLCKGFAELPEGNASTS